MSPHSGSQGQTCGFCLRRQLLLHTVTLSGGLSQIELMLVVLLLRLVRLIKKLTESEYCRKLKAM